MTPATILEFIEGQFPGFQMALGDFKRDEATGDVTIQLRLKRSMPKTAEMDPPLQIPRFLPGKTPPAAKRQQPSGEPSRRVQDVLALWDAGARKAGGT